MIAWVLIIYLGTSASMSVSGIESERECWLLVEKMAKDQPVLMNINKNANCYPYRGAYRF